MSHATDTHVPLLAQERTALDALDALGSSRHGLTAAEAKDRLVVHGRNELAHLRRTSVLRRFAAQFTDLFAVMLLVAAGITSLAYALSDPPDIGHLQLTIAILAVVVLNALI